MEVLITYTLSIGLPGAEREIDFEVEEKELEGLSGQQRVDRITELAYVDAQQYVECNIKNGG